MTVRLRQVAPCPRCGKLGGWHEKRVCKYELIFEADGEVWGSTDMERVSGGARRYCADCGRDITEQVQRAPDPAGE